MDISNNLTWDEHIGQQVNKEYIQTIGFLRRNIKVKSEPIKSIAYQTLVRPQLEYASEIWSPHTYPDVSRTLDKIRLWSHIQCYKYVKFPSPPSFGLKTYLFKIITIL